MLASMTNFADTMLAGLMVGALFGAWLFLNPKGLSASAYVTVQQQGIKTLNAVMPLLGAATILITIGAALLGREDRTRLWLLLAAALCFVAIGLITRFLNQPINAMVMTWGDQPPTNWTVPRDTWWRWHTVRLILGLAGLSLLVTAMLKSGWSA